jgi:hypothetical protein
MYKGPWYTPAHSDKRKCKCNASATARERKLESSRASSIENIRKHHRIKLHALNTPAEPTSINQHERKKRGQKVRK